ncbi:MAG: hypothetical protein ACOYVJ_12010 [Nitrospirota bacterium]
MDFWEKVKRDVQKGFKEGLVFIREGVTVVKEKAEELTVEGKKRLRIFDINTKVQREMSELGGRVYALASKNKNPMSDNKVKTTIGKIRKLEMQIAKLEGRPMVGPKTKPVKRIRKSPVK